MKEHLVKECPSCEGLGFEYNELVPEDEQKPCPRCKGTGELIEGVDEFLDNLATKTFDMTIAEAHMKGICIDCKEPAMMNNNSSDGVEEYSNSGLCEKCFDEIIAEEDE